MKQKVIAFSVFDFNRSDLEKLTNQQRYECFLESQETMSYDCPAEFFNDLNRDLVDTENFFWYLVNID